MAAEPLSVSQEFASAFVLRKALRFPPLLALILALTVMPAAPPEWAAKVLLKLADTLLPIAVLAVGFLLGTA